MNRAQIYNDFLGEFLFRVTGRHLVPRLRISGATTPLPHTPLWREQACNYDPETPWRSTTTPISNGIDRRLWSRILHAWRGIESIFSRTLHIFWGDVLKRAVTAVQYCSSLHSGILKYRRLTDGGQTYSNVEPIYHQHHDIWGWRE